MPEVSRLQGLRGISHHYNKRYDNSITSLVWLIKKSLYILLIYEFPLYVHTSCSIDGFLSWNIYLGSSVCSALDYWVSWIHATTTSWNCISCWNPCHWVAWFWTWNPISRSCGGMNRIFPNFYIGRPRLHSRGRRIGYRPAPSLACGLGSSAGDTAWRKTLMTFFLYLGPVWSHVVKFLKRHLSTFEVLNID